MWMGRLPAGLALSTVVANTIFAACSGSGPAACVVIGKAAIPEMRKMNYPDTLSTGVVAGTGGLAVLIPPSVAICVYGLIVNESIGKLLIAGILPGLVNASVNFGLIMIRSRHVPQDPVRYTWKEKFLAIRHLWVAGTVIVAILGGIYFGVCTPTEGGAFGAFVVFLLALFTRRLNWNIIWKSIHSSLSTNGMLLFILVSDLIFTRFLTLSGFGHELTEWVVSLEMSKFMVLLFVCFVYLFLGCFIASVGVMVITLPVFHPMMMALGYDSIWFGILVVMLIEIGMETPPFGINLFATKSIAPDIPLATIIRGTIPFIFRDLYAVTIICIFPQIVTFLPSLM